MPSSPPPEARIREYLDQNGPTEVSLEALVSTWRITKDEDPDIEMVARLLEDQGIVAQPELTRARPTTMIELTVVPPAEPEPEPAVEPEPEPPREAERPAPRRRSRSLLSADPEPEPAGPRSDEREPEPASDRTEPMTAADAAEAARIVLGIGAVVVIASLFLPWFKASQAGIDIPGLGTAWQWYGVLDVYLALVGVGAAALLIAGDARRLLAPVVLAAAAIALLCVAYQITNPPSPSGAREIADTSRGVGPFVTVVALIAVGFGAWLAGARELVEGAGTDRERAEVPAR